MIAKSVKILRMACHNPSVTSQPIAFGLRGLHTVPMIEESTIVYAIMTKPEKSTKNRNQWPGLSRCNLIHYEMSNLSSEECSQTGSGWTAW